MSLGLHKEQAIHKIGTEEHPDRSYICIQDSVIGRSSSSHGHPAITYRGYTESLYLLPTHAILNKFVKYVMSAPQNIPDLQTWSKWSTIRSFNTSIYKIGMVLATLSNRQYLTAIGGIGKEIS